MIGIYFSGTGNTKYCLEEFIRQSSNNGEIFSIESGNAVSEIEKHKDIILAYPIYYSNLPKIVKEFITSNYKMWNGKNVFIIATMGLFSGDGAGLSARLLKKYGANVIGGLHLKMPDCICDVKTLKRPFDENKKIVVEARKKIKSSAEKFKDGTPTQEGINIFYHLAGLFGQRLWFFNKTKEYSNKLKINLDACVGCGKCQSVCPMKNIIIDNGKATSKNSCTMCYRCINECPNKAITLLGNKIIVQQHVKDYL